MIRNKNDYLCYLEEDRKAQDKSGKPKLFGNELWKYTRLMRKYEYYTNCKKNKLFKIYLHWRFKKQSIKYGFSIPINTIGAGVNFIHRGTIVINPGCIVGENSRINCEVVIGAVLGTSKKAPVIGKNVYIAPGAKILGDIKIGNNVIIGANAVVINDVPDNVTVAGVPAKVISQKNTKEVFKYFVE